MDALLLEVTEDMAVFPGFVASTKDGLPTTLNRNSSDFSAGIIAALLKSTDCVIWTDVDGIYSAHPKFVRNPELLKLLSYKEALELTYFGATVLHPSSIAPCMGNAIPMWIRNTFNLSCQGTKIDNAPDNSVTRGAKGLSTVDGVALITVEGTGMMGVPGIASRLFSALREVDVNVILITQGSSEHSISVGIKENQVAVAKESIMKTFYRELNHKLIQDIHQNLGCTILAVVGDSMVHTPGVAGRVCTALGNSRINILAIAQGSSERNISLVIETSDTQKALQSVHNAFYPKPRARVVLALFGPGGVGSTLLQQIHEYNVKHPNFIISVKAIARTERMLLSTTSTLDLENWKQNFEKNSVPTDLEQIQTELLKEKLESTLTIVDCTGSEEFSKSYLNWAKLGINIVAANKKFFSGNLQNYLSLNKILENSEIDCFYEATVGAGLPVINTCRDLINTGDEILKIQGVLSGTLSFIFNEFQPGKKFSEIVYTAKKLGYTEPDPRDDLSALDFARKVVILARLSGLFISLEDLSIEGLVEKELQNCTVEEYLQQLPKFDEKMEKLINEAEKKSSKLRFIGSINFEKKKVKVGLKVISKESPLASLNGSDNMILFYTKRYKNPLVIRGPGAGYGVTAMGVFSDILHLKVKHF